MEDQSIVANDEQLTPQRSSDSKNYASFGCKISEPNLERPSLQSSVKKEMIKSTRSVALPTNTNDNNSTLLPPTSVIMSGPVSPSPLSPLYEQTNMGPDTTSHVLEIVRHIASYLSLSDVGSIAALYSSFTHAGGDNDGTGYNLPPVMQTDREVWIDAAGDNDSKTTRIIDPSLPRQHPKPDNENRGGSNDDIATSTTTMEGMKEHNYSPLLGSGPDECAGLGLDFSQPTTNTIATTAATTTKATLSQIFSSTKRICSKLGHSTTTNNVGTTISGETDAAGSKNDPPLMSTLPALIALSPDVPNDNGYYYDYGNELEEIELVVDHATNDNDNNEEEDVSEGSQHHDCSSYSSSGQGDEIHRHENTNDRTLKKQAETIRIKHMQQRLRNTILINPQSIRSYSRSCSLKQKQKLQPEQQRRRQGLRQRERDCNWKREDQSSPTPPPQSSGCTSYCLLTGMGRDTQQEQHSLFGQGGNSPAVLSVTDDDDSVVEEETKDHVAASCCYSEEQMCHRSFQPHQRTSPPPPYIRILRLFTDPIFQNVPLSIIFDASSCSLHTLLKTFESGLILANTSIRSIIKILIYAIHASCANLALTLHPKRLLEFFMHLNQYATRTYKMVRRGGRNEGGVVRHAVSSVTSSVVGSYAGTVSMVQALYRNNSGSGSSSYGGDDGPGNCATDDICRRISDDIDSDGSRDGMIERAIPKKMDSSSKVISYVERQDDALITPHDRKKLYYPVSLRPFIATIEVVATPAQKRSFRNVDFPVTGYHRESEADGDYGHSERNPSSYINDSSSEASCESTAVGDESDSITTASPFMYTPKSFPPSPSSRAHVLARGTRFAEDVIFLARAQLRIKKGLESSNDKTRAMAKALLDGSRLAIFNSVDVSGGIALTCGQHCASKVGDDLYCSARGMIPMLRNCFVYFEMSVSTPPHSSMMLHHASLSVGLSTLEMPLNHLVGACRGSAGLCSTGQILAGSQWCLPLEPRTYGSSSVVGCLLYLDDESAFETLDGVMVPASVVFNVNGQVVTPTGALCNDSGEDASRVGNTDIRNQGDDLSTTSSISLLVPRGLELYPTVTLHSLQTEVVCRFCSDDIVVRSREEIGLPMDVTVYAVDGSVLFDEESELFCSDDVDEEAELFYSDDVANKSEFGSVSGSVSGSLSVKSLHVGNF